MKKFLEQRVEELESEVKLLKAKNKLKETANTSKYLYNYTKYDPLKSYDTAAESVNLMSEPDLETVFASSFDETDIEKNPLDTITVNLPTHCDSEYPPYLPIVGSWDKDQDVLTDEFGFKLNHDPAPITTWGFTSEFDKTDSDFLKWISTEDAKMAYARSQLEAKKNNNVSLSERDTTTWIQAK